MTEARAKKLINEYIRGWKKNDMAKILSTLSPDVRIVESHGPTYEGIEKIKKWIELWVNTKSKVNKWDIISFYYLDNAAVFEWVFKCTVSDKKYHIEGITIAQFKDNKIRYIREYRTTKPLFKWDGVELADA